MGLDNNVVDDVCVGDLIDVDSDLVDVDVVDGHILLNDSLLNKVGCIDLAAWNHKLAGIRRSWATVIATRIARVRSV